MYRLCTALNSVVAPISIFLFSSLTVLLFRVFNRDCNRSDMMAWFLNLMSMHYDRLPFESRMLTCRVIQVIFSFSVASNQHYLNSFP